jgi:hypothetical protein
MRPNPSPDAQRVGDSLSDFDAMRELPERSEFELPDPFPAAASDFADLLQRHLVSRPDLVGHDGDPIDSAGALRFARFYVSGAAAAAVQLMNGHRPSRSSASFRRICLAMPNSPIFAVRVGQTITGAGSGRCCPGVCWSA